MQTDQFRGAHAAGVWHSAAGRMFFLAEKLRYEIGTSSGGRKSEIQRYQFGTPKCSHVRRRNLSCVFTEYDAECYVSTPASKRMIDSLCGSEKESAEHSNSHDS